MRISIVGARIIDPSQNLDTVETLHVDESGVLSIGKPPAGFKAERTINAKGLWLIPGLVDMATRLREPGQTQKGTIHSETTAALKRGILHLCCYPDTKPALSSPALIEQLKQKALRAQGARVHPFGALTTDLKGEQLADLVAMHQEGCPAFTNAQTPSRDALVDLRCYLYAASNDLMIIIRPEMPDIVNGTVAHEGQISTRLGLPSAPTCAETIAIAQHLELIAHTQVRAHFSCLSSREGMTMITQAREAGLPVTCDVSAHQLHLSEMDLLDFNVHCHLRPPLRLQEDMLALREGINSGAIQAIVSDHQPHEATAKLAPFGDSEPGLSALDTYLSLILHLVHEGQLDLHRAIEAMTRGPAQILGIDAGSLAVGCPASFFLVDPKAYWTVTPAELYSMGKNTPFMGWSLPGVVQQVIREGCIVYERAP